jgi:hypothetical protein
MSESLEARVEAANALAAEIDEQSREVMNALNDLAKQMQEEQMHPMALLVGCVRVSATIAVTGGITYDNLLALMNDSYAKASAIFAKQQQKQEQ